MKIFSNRNYCVPFRSNWRNNQNQTAFCGLVQGKNISHHSYSLSQSFFSSIPKTPKIRFLEKNWSARHPCSGRIYGIRLRHMGKVKNHPNLRWFINSGTNKPKMSISLTRQMPGGHQDRLKGGRGGGRRGHSEGGESPERKKNQANSPQNNNLMVGYGWWFHLNNFFWLSNLYPTQLAAPVDA